MRPRVLLGVGAWLLGATVATTGSMYAVDSLGHSFIAPPIGQLTVKMVNADLARENSRRAKPLPATRMAYPGRHDGPQEAEAHWDRLAKPPASPSQHAGPSPSMPAGVLLTSPDGDADAACGPGGAYLVYWSPEPGFEVDDVNRGPAVVASVVFRGDTSGILMKVSCQGGVPVKKLSYVGPEHSGWPEHHW